MEGAYIQMSGTQQLDLWCQRAALPTTRGRELPQAAYIGRPNVRVGSIASVWRLADNVRSTSE